MLPKTTQNTQKGNFKHCRSALSNLRYQDKKNYDFFYKIDFLICYITFYAHYNDVTYVPVIINEYLIINAATIGELHA